MQRFFFTFRSFPAALTVMLLISCGGGSSGPPPAPAATHLSVAAPAVATAGTAFNLTVTALDASNNVVIGYTGNSFTPSGDMHTAREWHTKRQRQRARRGGAVPLASHEEWGSVFTSNQRGVL